MISYLRFKEIMTSDLGNKIRTTPQIINLFTLAEQQAAALITSQRVKFGKKLEVLMNEILTQIGARYIALGIDEDHFFELNGNQYLIEQKVRDDHDSSAKMGHKDKLLKKISLAKQAGYPNVVSFIWFIDDQMKKNTKYYEKHFEVIYGGDISKYVHNFPYQEILSYFIRFQKERENELNKTW